MKCSWSVTHFLKGSFFYSEVCHLLWSEEVIIGWWNHRPGNLLKIAVLKEKPETVLVAVFNAWKLTLSSHICFLRLHLFPARCCGHLLWDIDFSGEYSKSQEEVLGQCVLRSSEQLIFATFRRNLHFLKNFVAVLWKNELLSSQYSE